MTYLYLYIFVEAMWPVANNYICDIVPASIAKAETRP